MKEKIKLKFTAAGFVMLLAFSSIVHAQSSQVAGLGSGAAPASAGDPAAVADFAKFKAALMTPVGLTVQSTVTFSVHSVPAPSTFSTNDSLEKSGRMSLQLTNSDGSQSILYDDGKNIVLYEPAAKKYTSTPTTGISDLLPGVMGDVETLAPGNVALAQTTMIGFLYSLPVSYFVGNFAIPGGVFSETKTTVNGKSAITIIGSSTRNSMTITYTYTVDASTYLPISKTITVLKNGVTEISVAETFTNVQPLAAPLTDATYVFTPPADKSVVAVAPASGQTPTLLANGVIAPDFTVETISGAKVKLSRFRGEVVVLDFWATWCGPCQMSLPHTDSIAKNFAKSGVKFLAICSSDERTAFAGWVKSHSNFFMNVYYDPAGEDQSTNISLNLYKVTGIPTQFVIGKDGKVAASFVGYDSEGDPAEKSLQTAVRNALAVP